MATSVVVTCCVTVHDCRVYVVLVRLLSITPSEEFFTKELPVGIYCCLGCTYRDMGNRLSFLNSGFKMGLVSTVMFETCSVLSQSSFEVPHKRFKIKDVRLNKPFKYKLDYVYHPGREAAVPNFLSHIATVVVEPGWVARVACAQHADP